MVVVLHRAERTDRLAEGLAALLATPPADPFAPDLVLVPAKGVERWLSQRLSHRLGAAPGGTDGVCAGVEFRNPAALIAEISGVGDDDPWSAAALSWPMLEVLDGCLAEPWAAVLARHLGRDDEDRTDRAGRRYALARRLAALFTTYAVSRPQVVEDWLAGRDTDGLGDPVPADLAWQPELLRRVSALVPGPAPPQRHAAAVARLRADPAAAGLPERLSLFGHTRLNRADADLVAALGVHREVHLWLPHPSDALWRALAGPCRGGPVRRTEDHTHQLTAHPLLASLGRDGRELQRTLAVIGAEEAEAPEPPPRSPGLLGWLQADLSASALPDPEVRVGRTLHSQDRSVQVHAAHGPARQVEVVREVLLGLLADDPTLEPRDIVVLCPDIEAYAPLVAAGFGLGEVTAAHPAHRLQVRLADRALVQTNPLLAVAAALLDLAGGRADASAVLDLAHLPPVRRRFGFTEDDLDQITVWVQEAGIRWAFDAEHREKYGVGDVVANTWLFGLDRILAGVTLSADSGIWLDRTLPLDDVGSSQIDLAGRLAEFVDRLHHLCGRLGGVRPLADWLAALAEGVASLTDVSAADAWQPGQVHHEFSRIQAEAGARADLPLRLSDVRTLLDHRLAGRPTRANFRTGSLTVCTMVPMRSVPHRVVCLLGLDDGVFPRATGSDGDDLLARSPCTGERDPRGEDRQLLLDAILAATQTLVISYTGADPHTGQTRPPAVPLGELLDSLDATATADSGSVAAAVTVHHPLQPFDRRNVVPGAIREDTPFSFDPAALAGARAAAGIRHPPAPLLPAPLAVRRDTEVALADLLGFARHPVRAFLRDRLDLTLLAETDPVADAIPVELGALERWAVADRLLAALLSGQHPDDAVQQEWRRGQLPPGRLGWRLVQTLIAQVKPIAATGLGLRNRAATAIDVDIDLPGCRRLRGTVPQVYGDRLVHVTASRLGPGHRLQAWVHLLALAAGDPDHNWTAMVVGRPAAARSRMAVQSVRLGPLDHRALGVLADLVELRDLGLAEPLPLPLKASYAYASCRHGRGDTTQALRRAGWKWESDRFPGEDAEPAQVRIWGPRAPLPGVAEPPGAAEQYPGETTRFGALAMRLWTPVLDAERSG